MNKKIRDYEHAINYVKDLRKKAKRAAEDCKPGSMIEYSEWNVMIRKVNILLSKAEELDKEDRGGRYQPQEKGISQ